MPGRDHAGRAYAPLAVAGAAALGSAYLSGHDPHDPGQAMLFCPWHKVTGLLCPACGGTRMVYDLLHGDWAHAWQDNAVLLLSLPLVAALYGQWALASVRKRPYRVPLGRCGVAAVLAVAVLWTVGRNLA